MSAPKDRGLSVLNAVPVYQDGKLAFLATNFALETNQGEEETHQAEKKDSFSILFFCKTGL